MIDGTDSAPVYLRAQERAWYANLLEETMADRNSNLGGRSDESQNPDLGRSEQGGLSGSSSSNRDSGLGSSRESGSSRDSSTSRDRGTSRETGMGDDLSDTGGSSRSGSSSSKSTGSDRGSSGSSDSDLGNEEIGDDNVSNR